MTRHLRDDDSIRDWFSRRGGRRVRGGRTGDLCDEVARMEDGTILASDDNDDDLPNAQCKRGRLRDRGVGGGSDYEED